MKLENSVLPTLVAIFTGNPAMAAVPVSRKIMIARVPDPGHQSGNRTHQGYVRKRILKPVGRFFSGCRIEGGPA